MPDELRREQLRLGVQGALDSAGLLRGIDVSFHPLRNAELGYRNRIRLKIDEAGQPCFFNPEKDQACAVLRPDLRDALQSLRSSDGVLSGVLRPFSHLELRSPDLDGRAGLYLVRDHLWQSGELREEEALVQEALGRTYLVDFGRLAKVGGVRREETGQPAPMQRLPISPSVFQYVPLGGFVQINFEINEALTGSVCDEALRRGARSAMDLYCGSGNFLLPLLSRGVDGCGVESNPVSIEGARRACKEQNLDGEFFAGDVLRFLQQRRRESVDFLVLDPPRAGLKDSLHEVVQIGAPAIALCSCNPNTWLKDVLGLKEAGYRLERVELFDMFPGTAHVEVLSVLVRD